MDADSKLGDTSKEVKAVLFLLPIEIVDPFRCQVFGHFECNHTVYRVSL